MVAIERLPARHIAVRAFIEGLALDSS